MNKLIDAVKTFLSGVEYMEQEENANYVVAKEDKELLQEAIDMVVAEVEKSRYSAKDVQSFFSWADNNGWSYGELTELWYNDEEEIEGLTIEEVLKIWEEATEL
mgnify:CR=1 FL=1